MLLRRQPASGAGFKLDFDSSGDRTRVMLSKVCDDGAESPEPSIELAGADATHVLRLRQRVVDSTSDLATRRRSMTRASCDGEPLEHWTSRR